MPPESTTNVILSGSILLNAGNRYWIGLHPAAAEPTDLAWWWNPSDELLQSQNWWSNTPSEVLFGGTWELTAPNTTECAYRVNGILIAGESISLSSDKTQVWANGIEEAELVATLLDESGNPLVGRTIQLVEEPEGAADFNPIVETDNEGKAIFLTTSTQLGTVTFTATDINDETLTATAGVQFVKRRVVVFVQGITTNLSDQTDQQTFPFLRSRLVALGFSRPSRGDMPESGPECADIFDNDGDGVVNDGCSLVINYSYNGGFVSSDGIWRSFGYECSDTAQRISLSVRLLDKMLIKFAEMNPNTLFVLVGHSQGGLIAFQGLRSVESPGVVLDAVVTLDGAVGGTPYLETGIAANFSCWGDPAARNLYKVWKSTKDNDRQGTTAIFGRKHLQNSDLVVLGQNAGTAIMTLGNRDDCVFDPNRCGVPGWQNSSTQVVENADKSELLNIGGNCADPFVCTSLSHSEILVDPGAINMVVGFIGSPVEP